MQMTTENKQKVERFCAAVGAIYAQLKSETGFNWLLQQKGRAATLDDLAALICDDENSGHLAVDLVPAHPAAWRVRLSYYKPWNNKPERIEASLAWRTYSTPTRGWKHVTSKDLKNRAYYLARKSDPKVSPDDFVPDEVGASLDTVGGNKSFVRRIVRGILPVARALQPAWDETEKDLSDNRAEQVALIDRFKAAGVLDGRDVTPGERVICNLAGLSVQITEYGRLETFHAGQTITPELLEAMLAIHARKKEVA